MSPNHLFARQTPQPLATTLTQPTTTLALSTTFTPPASCALPSQINILPPPGYLIWWNEPVPYTSKTISACYPSEFLRSYTSVAPTSARALGSSIVPAMSPLVCPQNFCTQYVGDNNYIACCPSGYKFETTGTPVLSTRPAYGGICYTDIPISQELTAVVYDSTGSAHQEVWAPSTTGAQGWAHPIDGWAASEPVLGCPAKQSISMSESQSTQGPSSSAAGTSAQSPSSNVSSATENGKKVGGGVIAGAVLGALVGLAAILGLVLLLLRRKKKNAAAKEQSLQSSQSDDGVLYHEIHQKDGDNTRVEASAVAPKAELESDYRASAHELGTGAERRFELPDGNGASQK
ncbi:hypothetical protein OPT61_g3020 [Boeremia exigua]|uniref:Uncharacterized protein n=1 Tax=Boeremia exigua TaxID=749465 RepID=A0ACC2IJF0_9PLEO|nr:hypothetical protein OPT61_g3020 [Boeremia exigua]